MYGTLRHHAAEGWGVFCDFLPNLWRTLAIKQVSRTPQRRFLYRTVLQVPRVQKEIGFLYRAVLQRHAVQQKAFFCTAGDPGAG